jgi:hypothetical protein
MSVVPPDTRYVQSNILITQDGHACLGDFGIVDAVRDLTHHDHKLETLRYVAPEHFAWYMSTPSKTSDVYSLAMTSFEVRCSIVNHPIIRYDHLITIRSSQGYCRIMAAVRLAWSSIFNVANDHPVQHTQLRVGGCMTASGI